RFGFLSAVTVTVGIVGALASTAPLAVLVAAAGWRGAFGIVSGVTLVASALCFAIVRDGPDTRAASAAPRVSQALVGMVEVLGNPYTWPPFLAFFCLYSAFGNLSLWIVPYLRDVYGLSARSAALTQGPLGAVLDARWAGAVSDGARVYPVEAYAGAFAACAAFALAAALLSLLLRETSGRNIYRELRGEP